MKRSRTPKRITIKKREGMYPEQFYLLEEGDIIKMVRSGSLRMVEKVHKSDIVYGETYMIELLKMRPSWTKGKNAWYCASDAFMFKPVKVKNDLIWKMTYEKVIRNRVNIYGDYYQRQLDKLEQKANTLRKGITFVSSLRGRGDQGFPQLPFPL